MLSSQLGTTALKQWFSTRSSCVPLADIWQYAETVLVVITMGEKAKHLQCIGQPTQQRIF